jgi:hypothetical protein
VVGLVPRPTYFYPLERLASPLGLAHTLGPQGQIMPAVFHTIRFRESGFYDILRADGNGLEKVTIGRGTIFKGEGQCFVKIESNTLTSACPIWLAFCGACRAAVSQQVRAAFLFRTGWRILAARS